MVASPPTVALPVDFCLCPGELSPVNDQAELHLATSKPTVADFDLEVEELAFYRQDYESVWCRLGTWDL